MQASDITAGWARKMLDTADHRVIKANFNSVWYNRVRIK